MAAKHLQVVYRSDRPPGKRPPERVVDLERSVQGLLSRGCRPDRLTMELDILRTDSEAKGLAVLALFSGAPCLKELSLHGLRLSPANAARISAAAPGLTKLSLSGASSSCTSLGQGLPAVLQAAPLLRELEVTVLEIGWGSHRQQAAVVGSNSDEEHPAWQALREHEPLCRLQVRFKGGCGSGYESRGPLGGDRSVAASVVRGVANLKRLRALGLIVERDSGLDISGALCTLGGSALTGLRDLTLRAHQLPADLLQALAKLRQLEVLSLQSVDDERRGIWNPARHGLQHVDALRQLTALTRMSLSCPLSPDSIKQAMAVGAWELPPRLAELHLDTPFDALQLAKLVMPQSLTKLTLSTVAKLKLPDVGAAEAVAALQSWVVAARQSHLALWGGEHSEKQWSTWVPQLGPMQLRSLALYDICLGSRGMLELMVEVSASLEELTVEPYTRAGGRLDVTSTLVALLRLRRPRSVILGGLKGDHKKEGAGSHLKELVAKFPRLRRQQAELAAGVPSAAGSPEVQHAAGAGRSNMTTAEASGDIGAAAAAAAAAEQELEAAVQELTDSELDQGVALKAVLLLLLARGVNVRLAWPNYVVISRMKESVGAVVEAILGEGAGAEWGRLEVTAADGEFRVSTA